MAPLGWLRDDPRPSASFPESLFKTGRGLQSQHVLCFQRLFLAPEKSCDPQPCTASNWQQPLCQGNRTCGSKRDGKTGFDAWVAVGWPLGGRSVAHGWPLGGRSVTHGSNWLTLLFSTKLPKRGGTPLEPGDSGGSDRRVDVRSW